MKYPSSSCGSMADSEIFSCSSGDVLRSLGPSASSISGSRGELVSGERGVFVLRFLVFSVGDASDSVVEDDVFFPDFFFRARSCSRSSLCLLGRE